MTVLRRRSEGETPQVTNVELFFDLVYVFAITQLSLYLREHLTARGALETLVLFLAVWWAWNYTAWATNWIDPEDSVVRLLMVTLMLVSIVMSAAIPRAFGSRGIEFADSYVALQVLRSGFMVAALRGGRMGRNYAQLLSWSVLAGGFWVGGAFAHGSLRLALWIAAVLVDYAAPWFGFALPRLGSTPLRDWTLAGGHLAERNRLVLLIAFGESILAIGATFAGRSWDARVGASIVVGFIAVVSLWWIYFVGHAADAEHAIARAADPARIGRAGYAYGHALMVAGIIVVADGIELAIKAPSAASTVSSTAVALGGPILYLLGDGIFKVALVSHVPVPRLAGVLALAVLAPLGLVADRFELSAAVAAVLLVLAALQNRSRPNVGYSAA